MVMKPRLNAKTPLALVGKPRHVVIVATPSASTLEVAGPAEAFHLARMRLEQAGRKHGRPYVLQVLSATHNTRPPGGTALSLCTEGSFDACTGPIDTLLVAGGLEVWTGSDEPGFFQWLRQAASSARRVGSLCTGAFVLAEAGLLDSHRVTTHWYYSERLQRAYPALTVDPEPIFIREGKLWTAAGVTTGLDMALAMIEDDLGLDTALRIARSLVLYVRRPGWQAQFSAALNLQVGGHLRFRDLPFWIVENLAESLTVEVLASRASMSVRNFNRRFVDEFGTTPARFVATLRAESARRLLDESELSREAVAAECGFGSIDSMERALSRYADPDQTVSARGKLASIGAQS